MDNKIIVQYKNKDQFDYNNTGILFCKDQH